MDHAPGRFLLRQPQIHSDFRSGNLIIDGIEASFLIDFGNRFSRIALLL